MDLAFFSNGKSGLVGVICDYFGSRSFPGAIALPARMAIRCAEFGGRAVTALNVKTSRLLARYAPVVLLAALLIALLPRACAQFPPPPGTGPGLAETVEAIDSARVTTRILYITAHPDDESGAALTYLARGL